MSDAELMPINSNLNVINKSLYEMVGKGYEDFWWWEGRYTVLKGSRGSKKSFSIAYWLIVHIMNIDKTNALVIRKVGDTNRDSTYAILTKVIYMMGVEDQWRMNKSPLELEFRGRCRKREDVGQKILFRGLDDPQKLASVQVTNGVLCYEWIEEAYQVTNEEDFDRVDQSIRGAMPKGVRPRIMLSFNPWHKEHWLKTRFFDNPDSETLAKTTDYRINEFLSDHDRKYFEDLKERNPRLYQVAGLGDWGVSEGLIYENWEERDFDKTEIAQRPSVISIFGLDFGYTNDPTAMTCGLLDKATRTIYIFDELYAKGLDNMQIADRIREMGYAKERIVADCAEPKSIYELQKYGGLSRVVASIKGPDIMYGIQKIQQFHIIVHPRCVNFLTEISLYCFDVDKKTGKTINKPIDDYNHCLVAGTMVSTKCGQKPIENVKEGELVLTHLGYMKVLASGITRPTKQPIWRMTLEDGTFIEGTEDHPFILRGWDGTHKDTIPMGELEKGMELITNKEYAKVESVMFTGRYEYVYDLTIDEAHAFFANGIYVANCMDALRYSILELLYRSGGNTSVVVGAKEPNLLNEPKLSYEIDEKAPKRKSRVFSA